MEKLLSEKTQLRQEKEQQEERLAAKDKELLTLRGMLTAQPNFRVK